MHGTLHLIHPGWAVGSQQKMDKFQIRVSALLKVTDWIINLMYMFWWWQKAEYLQENQSNMGEHANLTQNPQLGLLVILAVVEVDIFWTSIVNWFILPSECN